MAKKKSVLAYSSAGRDALMKKKRPQRLPTPLDAETRELILMLLREGATLAEICTNRKVTSYTRFYCTRKADAEFDAEVRDAAVMGAETAIAEAQEFSKAAAETGNPDLMRVAEAFARISTSYAEKIAPKEFGQLVKLGGADGGAITVQTINFAPVDGGKLQGEIVGKFEQLAVASRARDDNAEQAPLDPD